MLCNITIMSWGFFACFLYDGVLVRVFLAFCVVVFYCFAQTFIPLIIRNKMQDFFFYIFLANAIDIVIATIEIFLLLKDLPMWVMIFPLILLALLSGYIMMEFFFDKQMKLFKKKLLQIDKCIYWELDVYVWRSYYKGSLEFMWLPVNNDTLEPYCKFGDLLCLKKYIPQYNEESLDIRSLHNYRYVIEDVKGIFHYAEKKENRYIDIRPEMEIIKSNIKNIYEITDKISDLKVYDDTWYRSI